MSSDGSCDEETATLSFGVTSGRDLPEFIASLIVLM